VMLLRSSSRERRKCDCGMAIRVVFIVRLCGEFGNGQRWVGGRKAGPNGGRAEDRPYDGAAGEPLCGLLEFNEGR